VRDTTLSGRLARVSGGVVFAVLAMIAAKSIVPIAAGPPTMTSVSAILSKFCMVLFYALVIVFTLTRERPRDHARGLQPRLTALLGSFLLMASLPWLQKADLGVWPHLVSLALVLTGSALMVFVVSYLGRSFSIMAEARKLITDGPYRLVRHPLYVAELIATVGILVEYWSWLAAALALTQFAFQLQRMRNEEAILRRAFPVEYENYGATTKRLIPAVW
jgi:protein-S-isoprenylcysteine O-methyltransferase Ste14